MAQETASLIIKVDSRGAKSASADLDKLTAGAGKAEKATGALTGAWKVLTTVAASAALAKAVTSYIRMADASANMAARLRLATQSQEEFNAAHRATFEIAQRTSTQLESVVDLYAKLSQSTGQLKLSQQDVIQLTETITQTFQISGATAQEAAGGLRQLSQAMAGGVLRAEEFNSIIESSPRLVKALADGMGVEFGKVRQLVNEGKISSEELVNALLSQSRAIQSEFDQMPLTVGRATQQVRNALTKLVGDVDSAEGATSGLAETIAGLARTLESPEVQRGFQTFIGGVVTATSKLAEFLAKGAEVARFLGEEFAARRGGASFDDPVRMEQEYERIQARIGELGGFLSKGRVGRALSGLGRADPYAVGQDPTLGRVGGDMVDKAERELAILLRRQAVLARAIVEHQAGAELAALGAAARANAPAANDAALFVNPNGGRGRASADLDERTRARKELTQAERDHMQLMEEIAAHEEVVSDRQRELAMERIQRDQERQDAAELASTEVANLIAEMEFENSLIGKSLEEQQKMIMLRYAGAAATEEQREAIRRLVEDGIRAREAEADMHLLRDGAKDLFGTIVTDSARASDALNRFFDNLKARAADKLFEGLLSGFAGMAGGGGWSGFLQGFGKGWSGARAAGGPVMAGSAYLVGEHGPELFAPGQHGQIVPAGRWVGGGTPVVNLTVHGAPSQPETKIKPNGSGGFDMEILFKAVEGRMVQSLAGGGALAAAGKARFGWREVI